MLYLLIYLIQNMTVEQNEEQREFRTEFNFLENEKIGLNFEAIF